MYSPAVPLPGAPVEGGFKTTRRTRPGLGRILSRAGPLVPGIGFTALVIAVFLARLSVLSQVQLSRDEAASWYLASRPLPQLLSQSAHETFPPLYSILLKGWLAAFGDSETALRSLSLLPWLGTVLVAFLFARAVMGRWAALFSGVLLLLSPAITANSLLARMYTLEMFFATTAWWLAWKLVADAASWPAARCLAAVAGLTLAVAGEVWTMSLGIPLAGLQLLFALLALAWRRGRPASLAVGAVILGSASLAPWLPNLISMATNGHSFWTSQPDLASLAATVGAWTVGGLTGWWIGAAVLALALALVGAASLLMGDGPECGLARPDGNERRRRRLLALALVFGVGLVLVVWIYSQLRSIYDPRYFASSLPPFAILVSAGVAAAVRSVQSARPGALLIGRVVGVAAAATLTVTMLFGSAQAVDRFQSEQGVDPAQQVVQELSALARPGDVVMTLNAQSYFPLEYYLTRTGEARRLGVELYHWHRPTAAFFTGWEDIDPARVLDQAKVDTAGWRGALHISGSARIWLVTLNNPDYEYPRFGPAQTGSLRVLGSYVLNRNGVMAEIWESVPGTQ